MDVANSGGNCIPDIEKKNKRKKNRSAKQIERARKYRERKMYSQNVCNNVMYNLTYQTACHTPNEFEKYRYTDPMNSQLQFSGLYIPGVTEPHDPAYLLCNRSVMSPYETLGVSNIATVHQEQTSTSRGTAQEFEAASGKMSANIGTIVNEPVSKLRATAKEFIPASTEKVEPTLELNKDKNTAEEKVNIINGYEKTNEGEITTECKDSRTSAIERKHTHVEHIAGEDKPRIITEISNTQAERTMAKDEDNYIPEINKTHKEYVTHEGRNKVITETNNILCKHITDKDKFNPFLETTTADITYAGIDNIVIEDNVTQELITKADDENNVISKSNDTPEDDTCIITGVENNTIYEHEETVIIENTKKDNTRIKDENTRIVSKSNNIQEDDTFLIDDEENHTINKEEETMIIESNSTHKDTTTTGDEDNTISNNNNTHEDDTPIIDQEEDQTISDIQHEEINTIERNNTVTHDDAAIEEDCGLPENIRTDKSGMLGILGLFANSSLHCLTSTTAKYDSKPNEEQEFGYEYFTLSNLLK